MNWQNIVGLKKPKQYVCGYCQANVASNLGYYESGNPDYFFITICPNCSQPSYFNPSQQIPGISPGSVVKHVPEDIAKLYDEARRAASVSAYTASVLVCRKLLMNIAVSQGAKHNLRFIEYVDYLAEKGYVPPNGKGWVDHIRKKGNEATHEILLMTATDSTELISFSEMLLKFIYEFPAKIPKAAEQ